MTELKKTNFSVFGISNAFYLLDTYTGGVPCKLLEVEYPSVRQVVIASKTDDPTIRKLISKAILPADLKRLELSFANPEYWNSEYILQKMYYWTLYKFKVNPEFADALKKTGAIYLEDNLRNAYEIEELKKLTNYRGEILMRVRKEL